MRSGCAEPQGGIGWPVAALLCVAASACRDPGDSGAGAREVEPAARAAETRAGEPEPPPDPDLAALPEIAFVSERDGRAEIHAVRPDGSGRRVVASSPDASVYPAAGAGAAWLLAVRAAGGEGGAHREELAALDRDGRATALLAAGRIRNPSAAPGGWVAVESDQRSFRDIYRVPLAGGPARRLTSSRHGNFEPAVSPDGSRIAFTSSRDGNAEIYAMAADGSRETRLTAFHRDDWSPVWSPAGDALAFLSAREGPARVFLMRPDGTQLRRLLGDWDAEVEEEAPVFSPDGTQLALVARRADGGGEVWVADARTGRRWPVSRDGARDSTPAWSPDGRYLVFASQSGGQSDLVVARAAGGQTPRRLTRDPAQEWLPRWTAPAGPAAVSRRR